ncbi:MAG: BrnT family toxin [Ignavibacteriales bacterium]|nr:BrnT family toxin [Ignavibacteriales bacterium]
MKFEWDEHKRKINLQKHGIDFQEADEIFNNPMLMKMDRRLDYGEERYIGLGVTQKCVVLIVYTEPTEETNRIISIRKATKHERKIYEKYLTNRLGKS